MAKKKFIDFDKYTVKELKDYCRNNNIKGFSKLNKNELKELCKAYFKGERVTVIDSFKRKNLVNVKKVKAHSRILPKPFEIDPNYLNNLSKDTLFNRMRILLKQKHKIIGTIDITEQENDWNRFINHWKDKDKWEIYSVVIYFNQRLVRKHPTEYKSLIEIIWKDQNLTTNQISDKVDNLNWDKWKILKGRESVAKLLNDLKKEKIINSRLNKKDKRTVRWNIHI
ncbi:MAG: hypothetical protein ACFFG0_42660 [Candidatus Thorarchaeota archaeon]